MKKLIIILSLLTSVNLLVNKTYAQVPQLGAEVWLETQYSPEHIERSFKILAEHHMPIARIFIGSGDTTMYQIAFNAAEKYGIKIQATLSVPEHPETEIDLIRYAKYINTVVKRYKNCPALETWWLMNEPGQGPSSSPLAMQRFRVWLEKKYGDTNALNASWRKKYESFQDVQYDEKWIQTTSISNTKDFFDWFQFSRDNLTWIQQWIADEIRKEDTSHPFHVNAHNVFGNLIQYDFPSWRSFLSSLGASIHPAWHFGLLERNQFAMGMAATCDIIRGASEPNPFWVSELQGGNNTWSGTRPMGPEAEDIAQLTWTGIGSGAEKILYWLLNNKRKEGDAGEWSLLDFLDNPSDRLVMASKIARTIDKEKDFFDGARPLERKVVILLSPESTLVLARKALKDVLAGRSANAHILSALGYYQVLSELGIPIVFKYTDDFDWENKTGQLAILPNAVSVPQSIVRKAEAFVSNGNKLIIDGFSGFFGENEVKILQSGFFFEKLCGATIKDIRTKDNLFIAQIATVTLPLPVHLWQTEILNHNAQVIGREGDRITAVRNKFGKGEVIWIPMLAGLGAWLDKNDALAELINNEITAIASQTPLVFKSKTNNVIMQILQKGNDYVSVITNGNDNTQEVSLLINKKISPKIIFNSTPGEIKFSPAKFKLSGRQTIVIKWTSGV